MSDESIPPPEGSLKFWDESSQNSDGNVSRIFSLYGDDMQEIDENYDRGSALSIYEGHSYTPTVVKMDDMDIENERMHFLDSLTKEIHLDRAEMGLSFEKVTQCTVGWFNRLSFNDKLNFILLLLKKNVSISFLNILRQAISDPAHSKDLVYSTIQGIGAFEYDVVAEERSMSMDGNTLHHAQAETCAWFASFDDLQKLQLLLNLLVSSGGAIVRRVFLEVGAMMTERQLRNEQVNAIEAAGLLHKIAAKFDVTEEDAKELSLEILREEYNFFVETKKEEERLRKSLGVSAKNEPKKEMKEKGKDEKEKEDLPEEGKPLEEEKGNKIEKRIESLAAVGDEKEEEHPLNVAAREMLHQFEQALEKLRLTLKVDERGKQYPAPPPPVVEVEKKEKKEKKDKGEKEEKEDKGKKKSKKETDSKKGKGDKKVKDKKQTPQKKGKKGKGIDVDPGVDQIQLLPLTLNRRILRTLGEKQLKSLKQVSTYWAKMVDDITAEVKARKMIDDAIRKMAAGAPSLSAKSSKKLSKKGKKRSSSRKKKGSSKSSKSSKKSTKSSRSRMSAKSVTQEALVPSRVTAAQGHEATIAAFGGKEDSTSSDVYTNRCLRVNVACRFFGGRVTAQSADGRMFAASNARREVEFYSLHSGALLPFRLAGHDRCITCMVYLEIEGTEYIVTGSKDKSARLWNVPLLAPEKTYLGHTDVVTGVDATDKHVATTGADKILRVCDLRSAILVKSVSLDQAPSALCLSADPPSVFLGFPSGDIAVYSVTTNAPIITVAAHDAQVTCLHLAATVLASGGADKVARLWQVADFSANCLIAFKHNSAVCCVHLTRQQLVSADQDATFSVWSVATGTRLRQVRLPSACRIVGLAVHTDAEYARVLVSADLAVYAYEFYLHGSQRRRKSPRLRSGKAKVSRERPAAQKVHFDEGACASGGCTGLPITSRHPPCHRTTRQEERDKLRRRRGFPENRFFEAIHGVEMRPQGFLSELLNYEQMEGESALALCLFPQAQTTEHEVPPAPTYPSPDPKAPKMPDQKYKMRRKGQSDTCYQTLLQKYNARYSVLDV